MEMSDKMTNRKDIEKFKSSNGFDGKETQKDLLFHILNELNSKFNHLDDKIDKVIKNLSHNDVNTAIACDRSDQNRKWLYCIIATILTMACKLVFFP